MEMGSSTLRRLRERFPDDSKPDLLYLAGEPRSPRLEQELAAARFPLKVIVCYRMKPVDLRGEKLQAAFQQQPEAVLLYSTETARRFFELSESFLKETRYQVPMSQPRHCRGRPGVDESTDKIRRTPR